MTIDDGFLNIFIFIILLLYIEYFLFIYKQRELYVYTCVYVYIPVVIVKLQINSVIRLLIIITKYYSHYVRTRKYIHVYIYVLSASHVVL